MQPQLLESLDDYVEASRVKRLDEGGSLCQLSLRGDEEV
jgi:hypothetical protein